MLKDNEAKRILGHPTILRHFIHRYVPAPWATRVEDAHITQLPREHFSSSPNDGQPPTRRSSDLIFRVRNPDRPNEPGAVLVILLEAQSTRDRRMPLRMLEYVALTLRRIWSAGEPLPLVLPTVFYTGAEPWRVECALADMRSGTPASLAPFQPNMTYLLVTLGETKPCRANEGKLFAALLRVLEAESPEEVTRRLAELKVEAEQESSAAVLDAIANALADVLYRRHEKGASSRRIATMEDLMEETQEWLYTPGVPELREILAKEQEERARERELLLRLAQHVVPGLDLERARSLPFDELKTLVEEHT